MDGVSLAQEEQGYKDNNVSNIGAGKWAVLFDQ
jgi:hypothetical protein